MCTQHRTIEGMGLLQAFTIFYPSLGSCQAKGMVGPHQKHTAPGWPKILPQRNKDFLWSCVEWPLLQGKVAYMAYIFGLRQKLSCHPGTSSVFREHANEHDLDGGNIRTFTSFGFLQEMDLKETLDYCGDRSLVSILGCKSIGIPLLGVFFLPARTSLAPLTPSRFGLNHGTLRVQHGKVLFY